MPPNPEDSYTEKKNVHIPSEYALYLLRTYHQNLITSYRGVDCIKRFATALKIMTMMIINTPKKPITPLTDEEKRIHKKSKCCHICEEEFSNNENNKDYHKVKDHDHYTGKHRRATHSKCNLDYKVPKEIPVVFHHGSKYDYHFIINKLAKGIDGITCLGEDTEKYVSFKVPLKRDGESLTYKLKFIDSFRYMNRSLSNLLDNLYELNKQKCLKCKEKCKYIARKNDTLIHKCKKCNIKSYKSLTPLKEKFSNMYQFCNDDLDKFLLLLKKGVYPYKYMDSWNRFNEKILPPKKEFYSELNLQDITDDDYKHAYKAWNTCILNNTRTP